MRRIALLGALAAAAAWAPAPARIAGTARVRVAGCRSSARCFAAAADVDDDSAVPAEASEAERLTAEASRLRAQADVLRLEAEKDALLLEKQVLVAKDLQRAAQAELISNLRLYADANDVDGLRTTLRRKRSIVDMALFDAIREGALDDSTRLKTVEEFYTAVMDALVMEDEKLAARIKSDLKSSSLPAFGMAKKAPVRRARPPHARDAIYRRPSRARSCLLTDLHGRQRDHKLAASGHRVDGRGEPAEAVQQVARGGLGQLDQPVGRVHLRHVRRGQQRDGDDDAPRLDPSRFTAVCSRRGRRSGVGRGGACVCVWEIAPVSLCSARVSLPLTPPLPSNRWIPTASRNA